MTGWCSECGAETDGLTASCKDCGDTARSPIDAAVLTTSPQVCPICRAWNPERQEYGEMITGLTKYHCILCKTTFYIE